MTKAALQQWHIMGRGAIGLLWARSLKQLGLQVNLITKDGSPRRQTQTIGYTNILGELESFDVESATAECNDAITHLVVPLKAYDVQPALKQVKNRLHNDSVIILCHNGMGTVEQVQQLLGKQQPLIFATTTHGAYRTKPYQVTHSGLGETKMGRVNEHRIPSLENILNDTLKPVTWHNNIAQVLWQKLAINCVINPLSAIEQCRNGDLLDSRFECQINRLCQEISAVANACLMPLSFEELIENSTKVMQATAKNYSSMNRDVAAKRQTEIDFITGYLLQQAQLAGIDTPANLALYQKIKAL